MKVLWACVLLAAVRPALPAASTPEKFSEKFSVVSAGEVVGTLAADGDAGTISIAYQVSDNGRGPKLAERIVLGGDGLPTLWEINGTTAFGGAVAESFKRQDKRAEWQSQADRGRNVSPQPALYIANDSSPWSYGLYARAALRAPGGTLQVLPGGQLQVIKLRDLTVGDARVTAYNLTGIDLTPDIVLLDDKQHLFAHIESSSVLVRAGYEDHAQPLIGLGRDLQFEWLERLQREAAHRSEMPLRIVNVRLFNPENGRVGVPVNVVVYRGAIASILPESPAPDANIGSTNTQAHAETVIDGNGGTLVPGLYDMHSHSSALSGVFYLAAGVTNVRDQGNDNAELLRLSAKIDAGEIPGPRIYRAGFLEGRSPYSARNGFIADSLAEALTAVHWYADHGYRQIKIYNSMNPGWVAPIAAEAHRLGLRVSGHVPAFMSPDRAIHDGYDEINHVNQLVLGWLLEPQEDTRTPLRLTALGERAHDLDLASGRVRATVELMKTHGTALDTTLVTLERLMLSRAGQVLSADVPYLDHMPISYQRYRKRSFVAFESPAQERRYERSFERLLEVARMLYDAGIRLLPGTDDKTGFTLHRELELYVRAGIPPGRALSMATLDCARYLGEDQQLGSIVPGKRADFFLVDGDPTADISVVRRPRLVVKDDHYYFPAQLYQALGIRAFGVPPAIHATQ